MDAPAPSPPAPPTAATAIPAGLLPWAGPAAPGAIWDGALRLAARHRWLLGLCLALLLTVPSWLPWLDPHINLWQSSPGVDDAKSHMLRLYMLDWLVTRGAWLPRWLPDLFLGFGYPTLNFYAPGSYYLALALKWLLRLDVWDAYRAAGIAATLLGAGGAYAFCAALWRRLDLAALSALLLVYSPYAFQLNLFRRGDVPEMLGLALIPWLLLALWRLWHAGSRESAVRWLLAATGAGAAEILVHNLTALMAASVAGVWVLYLLVTRPIRRGLPLVALAGALAAGSAAFFWLPAMAEGHAVQLEWLRDEGLDYRLWFVHPDGTSYREGFPDNRQTRRGLIDLNLHYPHQLVAPPKMSLAQAAVAVLAAASLALAAAARRVPGAALTLFLAAAGCWFLTLDVSEPVWRTVPGMPFVQFPWRFMGPLAVCLALAAAGALAALAGVLQRRWPRGGTLAARALVPLIGGVFLFNSLGGREFPLMEHPLRVVDGRALLYDELNDGLGMGTLSGREFLPREVYLAVYTRGAPRGGPVFLNLYPPGDWVGGLLFPLAGDLRVTGLSAGPLWLSARVANDGPQPAQLGIHQLRFLGWRAWLDGRRTAIDVAPYIPEQQASAGFMVLAIPPGEHTVNLAFGPTTARLAGTGLSVLCLLAGSAAAAWLLHRRPAGPVPGRLRRRGRLVAAGWLVVALGLGYVMWRTVRPLSGRLAVSTAAVAAPTGGVWGAPPSGSPGQSLASGAGWGLAAGRSARTLETTTLLVNLAEAVRLGQAHVESPSGPTLGPDRFVDVRYLTVTDAHGTERGEARTSHRQWLYLHPPATASVDVRLPAGRRVWLEASLALDPGSWTAPQGDGVRYQALVTPLSPVSPASPVSPVSPGPAPAAPDAGPVMVLDEAVNPRAQNEQRRWLPVSADLSRWAGATVRLTLRTNPRDDVTYDWAGWGNPVVVVHESPRADPGAQPIKVR